MGCEIPREVPRTGVRDPVQGLEFVLERSRLFQTIAKRTGVAYEPLRRSEPDALLLRLLALAHEEPALVLPLRPRDRTVAVALGAGAREAGDVGIERFALLASKAADALDLVRLRRRILSV